MVKENIKVECINGFKMYDSDKILIAEVTEGKEYSASLYKPSGEYFAKDDRGREFCVGELDFEEDLSLDEDFKLI